jgi:hypothetical protein
MPSRTTTATFAPNSFLGSSVLKGATFHFSSGKGIYEADDTMDLAARLPSAGGHLSGGDLRQVWVMHHWVLLLCGDVRR